MSAEHALTERSPAQDASARQAAASDPHASVWVGASAGTGKTKVLTDRILRLLLPRSPEQPGTHPEKILAITFTKAGAGEMSLRLNDTLAKWSTLEEPELAEILGNLLGRTPERNDINAARALFSRVVDTPGGLKIMTIHAFCQSVLNRFPLEAGIPPYFKLIEDSDAKRLMDKARAQTFAKAQSEAGSPLANALHTVLEQCAADSFPKLMNRIFSEKRQFKTLLATHFGAQGIYEALCTDLDISSSDVPEILALSACSDDAIDYPALKRACDIYLGSSKKSDLEKGERIASWISLPPEERLQNLDTYRSAFFKKDGDPFKDFATKAIRENNPDLQKIIENEIERLTVLDETIKRHSNARHTYALLAVAEIMIEAYDTLKSDQAVLDYDDLILKTVNLLQNSPTSRNTVRSAMWVLYKLDKGLEHILVDESQDTNPDQWAIIDALCDEFFTHDPEHDQTRTLFVVGDEKQSIYSFQRASPQDYKRMKDVFAHKITSAHQDWRAVALQVSFRTSESVLRCVDATFARAEQRAGVSETHIEHTPFRQGQAGHVELWPLYANDDEEQLDLWDPPTSIIEPQSGQSKLTAYIAETIRSWIDEKKILPSRDRPIKPGDIMILVKSRGTMVERLSRALKDANIPVSGADRMVLENQLVIEDMLTLAETALLQEDDLSLACVLKSPFINMDEDTLRDLCFDRAGTLWDALRKAPQHRDIVTYIEYLRRIAPDLSPPAFFETILKRPCPAHEINGLKALKNRLGNDIADPLNEFMALLHTYQLQNVPSLQGFLHWQKNNSTEIKRELEDHADQVRIMTVHGSKGLQAPIVILPDTILQSKNTGNKPERNLLFPNQTGARLPLWAPRKEFQSKTYAAQMSILEDKESEEYRRLLYVAMTRAEDQLYIGGAYTKKQPLEDSWYYQIKRGILDLHDHIETEEQRLIIANEQTAAPDRAETHKSDIKEETTVAPDWLFVNPPKEESSGHSLQPSRLGNENEASLSPLSGADEYRFRRGNLTHKLLEFLPGTPSDQHQTLITRYLERYGTDLSESIRASIGEEVLKILNHPEFVELFGPSAQAEVPISGTLPSGQRINGQIDRLLITETDILIVDYKSNRPSPARPEDIPAIYRQQLQAYADVLKTLYPQHTIKAGLLWTDKPLFMPISLET